MKKFRKWTVNMLLFLLFTYIFATFLSGYLMYKTTSITYNATAYGSTIRSDNVDFKSHSTQRCYYDYTGKLTSMENHTITNGKIIKIKLVCSFSLLPLWRHNYLNPFIKDGDQWYLIRNEENVEYQTFGSNAYPLGYIFVFFYIDSLFEK